MKKLLLLICLATLCQLAWTTAASAHPLGNFTINRFSRVEVAGHRTAQHAWLGRALRLNPHFSILWAPVARRELR